MKALAICCAVLSGLWLAGCSSMSPTVDGKTHVYSLKQQCPNLLEMNVGQTLMFAVPENPSTGYIWQAVKPLQIFEVDEIYQQDQVKSQKPILGVGGEKLFRFTVLKPGEELIRVKHARSWEKNALEEWSCRVRVSSFL